MSKTSLIVFLLMCNNFCNTMDLSETTNTKSNIQQEQYPRIVNPDALTTAKRYGSTLPPKEFDKLVYGKEPYFGSDYELCVPDVNIDYFRVLKKAYDDMFYVWKMLPAILENAPEFNQDIINVIRSFYIDKYNYVELRSCFTIMKVWGWNKKLMALEYLTNHNLYERWRKRALSKIEQRIAQCNNTHDENNVAALQKLYDDQSRLINNDNITEQNIIRCLQWWQTDIRNLDLPAEFSCRVGGIATGHLENKIYNQNIIASLYEQEESSIATPIVCTRLNQKHPIGTSDSMIYIRLNENNKYDIYINRIVFGFDQCSSLKLDPHYNPEIHGPKGVVWFKYPHEKDFDAGLNGEGSSWMHEKDAKAFSINQYEQLKNMSNISLRKVTFTSLAIKNGLLLGAVGLGIAGSAFCMASHNSGCSMQ